MLRRLVIAEKGIRLMFLLLDLQRVIGKARRVLDAIKCSKSHELGSAVARMSAAIADAQSQDPCL